MGASMSARPPIIVLSGGLATDTTSSVWQQLADAYLLDLSASTPLWRQFKGHDSGKEVARTSTRPFTTVSEVAVLSQPAQVAIYNQVGGRAGWLDWADLAHHVCQQTGPAELTAAACAQFDLTKAPIPDFAATVSNLGAYVDSMEAALQLALGSMYGKQGASGANVLAAASPCTPRTGLGGPPR